MGEQLLIHYENVEICRQEQIVLRDVNMKLYAGEFVYFIGKVGSGKSSLLKTIYGEIPISDGEASVLDYDIKRLKRREIPYLRRKIGVVFQDFQLLTDRSVFENLQFVLKATGWTRKQEIADRIEEVLHQVGMHTKAYKMPHELSGGEQQRIVIARSLLNSPQLILADEPTGNLDPETGRTIVALLHNICHTGTAVIMTTHNHHLVKEFPGRLLKCENRHLHEVEENNE
ncbi:MAG TPA: ATP-binding cassette domain-containing protein [Candidatus Gallibacteroides avistercoris]|uniref:Cell division ATP-binding protein FtsE n=1 Tax=Candidatus Gallibacteroides avistercoris TaxID=2840833 RepID=A0A9D1M7B5_9BACT|nr:ATP-binding cassette domain-containing protein [Candidatus Gallibacteroides avistercoris]